MEKADHSFLDQVISTSNIDILASIWLLSLYQGSRGKEMRDYIKRFLPRIAKNNNLPEAKTFRDLVESYDRHIYSTLCTQNPNWCLYEFAKQGDWRNIRVAIKEGANDWESAMEGAVKGGYRDLVLFFIEKGANDWNFGLYNAVTAGDHDLVDLFIDKGANNWDEVLPIATFRNDRALVDLFVDKGASNWDAALYMAVLGEHEDLIDLFLQKGASSWVAALEAARRNDNRRLIDFFQAKIDGE